MRSSPTSASSAEAGATLRRRRRRPGRAARSLVGISRSTGSSDGRRGSPVPRHGVGRAGLRRGRGCPAPCRPRGGTVAGALGHVHGARSLRTPASVTSPAIHAAYEATAHTCDASGLRSSGSAREDPLGPGQDFGAEPRAPVVGRGDDQPPGELDLARGRAASRGQRAARGGRRRCRRSRRARAPAAGARDARSIRRSAGRGARRPRRHDPRRGAVRLRTPAASRAGRTAGRPPAPRANAQRVGRERRPSGEPRSPQTAAASSTVNGPAKTDRSAKLVAAPHRAGRRTTTPPLPTNRGGSTCACPADSSSKRRSSPVATSSTSSVRKPRRRKLDRQWEPVETADDLGDARPLGGIGVELRGHGAGPLHEQLDGRPVVIRRRQRRHDEQLLARTPAAARGWSRRRQRSDSRRGDDRRARRSGRARARSCRAAAPPRCRRAPQPVGPRAVSPARRSIVSAAATTSTADSWLAAGQFAHHDRAVRASRLQAVTDLDEQPGLADAAGSDQRQQAPVARPSRGSPRSSPLGPRAT